MNVCSYNLGQNQYNTNIPRVYFRRYNYKERKQREMEKDIEELRKIIGKYFRNGEIPQEITDSYNMIALEFSAFRQNPISSKCIRIHTKIQNSKLLLQKKIKERNDRFNERRILYSRGRIHSLESNDFFSFLRGRSEPDLISRGRVRERRQRSLESHSHRMQNNGERQERSHSPLGRGGSIEQIEKAKRESGPNQTLEKDLTYASSFSIKEGLLSLDEEGILKKSKINEGHLKIKLRNLGIPDLLGVSYSDCKKIFCYYERFLKGDRASLGKSDLVRMKTFRQRLSNIFASVSLAKKEGKSPNRQHYCIYKIVKRVFYNLSLEEKSILQLENEKRTKREAEKRRGDFNEKVKTYMSELIYGSLGCNDRFIQQSMEVDRLEFGEERVRLKENLPLDEKMLYYLRDFRESLFEAAARASIRLQEGHVDEASAMQHLKDKLKDRLNVNCISKAAFGDYIDRTSNIEKMMQRIEKEFEKKYTPESIAAYLKEKITSYQTVQNWFCERFPEESAESVGRKIFDPIKMEVYDHAWAYILYENSILEKI